MAILRAIGAYIAAAVTTGIASAGFYTQQVLAKQASIGVIYTPAQQFESYVANLFGLTLNGAPSLAGVLSVALVVGFIVAFVLKRILTPLARIAYPLAGAVAVFTVVYLIENVLFGGGTGIIDGARDATGMVLQGVAGGLGGLVFAVLRPHD